MKEKLILLVALAALAVFASAQTTPEPQGPASSQPVNSMPPPQADTASAARQPAAQAIPAILAKSVDSRKAKAGDPIEATTSVSLSSPQAGQIPEGSKIVGHITEAKAKSKGDPQSTLSFAFDKIVLKNGKDVPFKAVAQAIGPEQSMTSANFADNGGTSGAPNSQAPMGAGRGVGGGTSANSTTGGGGAAGEPAGSPTDVENQSSNSARLPENAIGVVGMKGLTLATQADAAVISSDSKSVKLNQGTQLMLRPVQQ